MDVLSLRGASEKYRLPLQTVSRWAADGLIRIYARPVRRGDPMLVYEHDVAELAARYVPGRGRHMRRALRESIAR